MESKELYQKLKSDFIKEGITDLNWAARMPDLDKYLHNDFKRCGMDLMCDFTDKIDKVYTTVFLSDKVLSKILSDNVSNAMIFSHHPTNWDIEHHNGNYAATEEYISKLRDRNISIYILHHPLDNYGDYSTCKTLADSINLNIERPAFLYCGALCGVIGTVVYKNIGELHEQYSKAMGHKTSLYRYENVWKSLFECHQIFVEVSKEVAELLKYIYPEYDKNITRYTLDKYNQHIRNK